MRKILNGDELKALALETIEEVASIVKQTLGPGGNPIILQQFGQNPDGTARYPLITKDGVTVSEAISFRDPTKNTVAQAILQVARNTVNSVGDGPQPLYSKVLTPFGFVSMEDVEPGMEVCGTNGTIQTVLGVFPKGEKEVFEVEFSDGRIVECCADHLWKVTTNWGTESVVTTATLIEDYKTGPDARVRHKYYVPNTVVEFYENSWEMPLDPYLVGLLLGDGSLSGTGSIELSLGQAKEHVLDKLVLPKGIVASTNYIEDKNYFRVKLNGRTSEGRSMSDILNSIGLLGVKSSTKFIPKSYLYSSRQSREQLLQGLLDTDGHINVRNKFEYSSISDSLYRDFKVLVQSLGISTSCSTLERKPNSSYSQTPIHRIIELKGYKYGDKIVRIAATGRVTKMQCIKVSNPDCLYITDNFIVTHNTTSAVVLAEAMYKTGYRYLKQGSNGIQLYNELKEIKDQVISELEKMKVPITKDDLINVARISANGDEEVAQKVSDAIQAVGEDGHVDLQEGFSRETVLDLVEGAVYKQGWRKFGPLGALMVNDKVRNIVDLERPAVLLYAGDIKDVTELFEFLKGIYGTDSNGAFANTFPLLLVAYDFGDEVKNAIIQLKVQAKVPIAAIKAPFDGSPNARTQMLEDLAVLLGGQVTARGIIDLKTVKDEHLGCAERVEISAEEIVFFNGHGAEDAVLQRVNDLKEQLKTTLYDYDKGNLRLRVGKLTGGIAILRVGGDSELEMKERKDRIEDALCAAKVAVAEGIVPGGGYALYRISQAMTGTSIAAAIMREALQAPIKQIITNVGLNAEVVLSHMPKDLGFDARKKQYVSLMREGIVDPLKVTKSALENAVSIVGLLLTTGGAVVADTESKDGTANPLAAMMGM